MLISSIIEPIVFYMFALLLIVSSIFVITARNPVRGILCLIVCFFASAALWLLLEAEFLALILIVVYVGAVMTLFLFVVMMLNINLAPKQQGFVRYLPLGILALAILVAILVFDITPQHFGLPTTIPTPLGPNYNNAAAIGSVLYTTYLYPFELAAVLLLVAIISAISLAFRGRRPDTKGQKAATQLLADRRDRLRIVKMPSEKKQPNVKDKNEKKE